MAYRGKLNQIRKRAIKLRIFERDKGKCVYCGVGLTLKTMTMDHVVPACFGGARGFSNLVLSCDPCNQKKGFKHPSGEKLKTKKMCEFEAYLNLLPKEELTQKLPL